MANASNATPAVIAACIVDAVGGSANITNLTHCATRLHFELDDAGQVSQHGLESLPGVVATEKVVSYLSHTLRSRVVTQNEARPGVTWNLRIVICEFHVVPGLFLFSGDFRQSKPDLACGSGATRQARPVNGERTRQ